MPKRKREYPEIEAVGCPLRLSKHGYSYVRSIDLSKAMRARGQDYEEFGKAFGTQTCPMEGMFAWDVEAALRRVRTGEKEHMLVWD